MGDLVDISWPLGFAAVRRSLGLCWFFLHGSSMTRLLERFKLEDFQSSPLPEYSVASRLRAAMPVSSIARAASLNWAKAFRRVDTIMLCMPPVAGPQFRNDLIRRPARLFQLPRWKRDRPYACVSAPAVALANLCQVLHRLDHRPRIGTDCHLGAEAALAESHAVNAIGVKVIGHEFVVVLEFMIGYVEEDGTVFALGTLAQNVDGAEGPLGQHRDAPGDHWLRHDFIQGPVSQHRNQGGDELRVLVRLDHHGQLHRWLLHLDCGLRIAVERSINDVSPLNQLRHGRGIEAKPLRGHSSDELCARAKIGIVEFGIAQLLLEMGGIFRRQEGTLVMVEPPGDTGRRRVFEIDNCVLVAGEIVFVEESASAMYQPRIFEFRVADALAVETRKQRCGTSAIETLIVVEDSYPHKPFRLRGPEQASQNIASAKQRIGRNEIFEKVKQAEV